MRRLALLAALALFVPDRRATGEEPAPTPLRDGPWRITLRSPDLGALRGRLVATRDAGGAISWSSRPKALEALLPAEKAALARVFLSIAPDGSLLHVDRVARKGERLEARFVAAALGEFTLEAKVAGDGFSGRLVTRDGSPWGTVEAAPDPAAAKGPPPRVLAAAVEATRSGFYDPRVLEGDAWKAFLRDLENAGKAAADDVEVAFAFYALKQPLRVSHYALLRREPDGAKAGTPPPPRVSVDEARPGVARLVVKSFSGGAAEIDDAFRRIAESKAKALVIDLRGNPGGNLSAMAVAAHLVSEPTPGGTFVGAAWWRKHTEAPSAAEIAAAPPFERTDVEAFRATLAETGLVAARVSPAAPRFAGRVAVLVDHVTASACEPLVAVLAERKLAAIVGERTAGAMLSSDEIDLGDGWVLRVPAADYRTPGGARPEGRGVDPTIEVDPEEALERALEWLAAPK